MIQKIIVAKSHSPNAIEQSLVTEMHVLAKSKQDKTVNLSSVHKLVCELKFLIGKSMSYHWSIPDELKTLYSKAIELELSNTFDAVAPNDDQIKHH